MSRSVRFCPGLMLIAFAAAQTLSADRLPDRWRVRGPGAARAAFDPNSGRIELAGADGTFLSRPAGPECTLTLRVLGVEGAGRPRACLLLVEGSGERAMARAVRLAVGGGEGKAAGRRPVWLRLVRMGPGVGMYRSQDGRRWRHRDAGRTLDGKAPVRVGLALTGGDRVEAAIDRLAYRPAAEMPYRTSWVGNSLPGPITSTVSFNMTGLFVGGDGTCWTTSFFEEQGHCIAAYRDGRQVAPGRKTPPAGIALAVNARHAFTSHKTGFQRLDPDLVGGRRFVEVAPGVKGHTAVRGLAASASEVFVANRPGDRIEVYGAESLERRRQWAFPRPGPMCLDDEGRLWAVSEGFDESPYECVDGPYPHEARICRLDAASGKVLQAVTGPKIPTGIAVDRRGPGGARRLLVADNGPDQQVKVYDVSGEAKLLGALGREGGIYAGTPGRVADDKLNGLSGVGVDRAGRIYVSSTGWPFTYIDPGTMANQVTLRCFPAQALGQASPKAAWKLESLAYIFDGATLDPRDETMLYAGADQVFRMDWSRDRGREGEYVAFTANRRAFPREYLGRRGRCSPLVRWIGGRKFLALRDGSRLLVYRFDPEARGASAVPCAAICPIADRDPPQWPAGAPAGTSRPWVWTDGRGGAPRDGKAREQEYASHEKVRQPGGVRWDIDANGDVWQTGWRTNHLVRFAAAGLADGVPEWTRREVIPGPEPFTSIQWSRYDAARDVMVLAGATRRHPGTRDIRRQTTYVARYRDWSKGNRKAGIELALCPRPGDYHLDGAMGLDVVGDFLYVAARPGNVAVYDLRRGNRVIEFCPGPEVNGSGGYFDRSESAVQAFRLASGEYVALCQENAYCKVLIYRWRPAVRPAAPPDVAPEVWGQLGSGRVALRWRTPRCGIIEGYDVHRADAPGGPYAKLNDTPLPVPHYVDARAGNGTTRHYRVAVVNAAGRGPLSQPVALTPRQARAEFVGIDAETQGDWKGRYGRDGFYVVGDWDSPGNPSMPPYLRVDGAAFRAKAGHKPRPVTGQRFLLKAAPGSTGRASFPPGSGYSAKEQAYTLEFTDGRAHRLTLYAAGHGNGFATRIELRDASTGRLLDAREIAARGDRQGRYVTWDVAGGVELRFDKLPEGFGNFLAGFFFDPVPGTPSGGER